MFLSTFLDPVKNNSLVPHKLIDRIRIFINMLYALFESVHPTRYSWLEMTCECMLCFWSSDNEIVQIVFHIPGSLFFVHLIESVNHAHRNYLFGKLRVVLLLFEYFKWFLIRIQAYVILFILARISSNTDHIPSVWIDECVVYYIFFSHHSSDRLSSFLSMKQL